MLEIIVGACAGRIELSELSAKLEAGSGELQSVVRGHGCPFQGRPLPGRGRAKADPQPLDLLLVLADGGFELRPLLSTTSFHARRGAVLPAEQRGLRARRRMRAREDARRFARRCVRT